MGNPKVLLISDKERKYNNLRAIAEQRGVPIDIEHDISNGYELLKAGGYTLVIANISCASIDGHELIDKIQNSNLACGVIFIDGTENYTAREELKEKGAFSFVKKADDDIEILKHIDNYFTVNSSPHADMAISLDEMDFKLEESILTKMNELKTLNEKLTETSRELDQTKQRLQAKREYLVNSDRMISIGQMVASIVHEINNPLTSIISLVGAISIETRANSKIMRYNEMLSQNIDKLRDLTMSILSFSHQSKSMEAGDSHIVISVEELIAFYGYEVKKKNISMNMDFSPVLPRVVIPKVKLQQVLLNVMKNSVYAVTSEAGRIDIRAYVSDGMVILEVEDNGEGIPKEKISEIFNPFFSTKPTGKGTGLGLFICKEILENHSSDIEIKSEHLKGTTVTLKLAFAK